MRLSWPPDPDEIKRRLLAGETFVQIAKDYGVPVNTLSSWAQRRNLRLRDILPPGYIAKEVARQKLRVARRRLEAAVHKGAVKGLMCLGGKHYATLEAWAEALKYVPNGRDREVEERRRREIAQAAKQLQKEKLVEKRLAELTPSRRQALAELVTKVYESLTERKMAERKRRERRLTG